MLVLIISLILIIAILLILVVLMQNSKGGLGAMGGGGTASQLIGVKKASDFLEKSTWIFIVLVLGLSIGANVLLKSDAPENEGAPIGTEIEAPINSAPIQPQADSPSEGGEELFNEETK